MTATQKAAQAKINRYLDNYLENARRQNEITKARKYRARDAYVLHHRLQTLKRNEYQTNYDQIRDSLTTGTHASLHDRVALAQPQLSKLKQLINDTFRT